MYAEVIVEGKSKFTDTFYTYDVGDLALNVGDRVEIPFGNKTLEGYVFKLKESTDLSQDKIKSIIKKVDFLSLNEDIIKTCIWMKSRYGIKYYDAIKLFIPSGKIPKEIKEKEPYKDREGAYSKPDSLTEEQSVAVNRINEVLDFGEFKTFLLYGVTASGKTEVYMEAISKALSLGKTAIMLVPEISLTGQVLDRFIGRFGKDNIAVLHSKLTNGERLSEWKRIREGKAKIVVGARMGVFAPLSNLGLIIMDEEHEATYKADMTPKYDTIDIATKRLSLSKGVLILGSATPSVISFERSKEGLYELLTLKERYNKTPLPSIEVVDMRKEIKRGNTSILSNRLIEEMDVSLSSNKQVILLQNRRGYSNYLSCRECGNVIKCPTCDISLTYHKKENKLICHYCGKKYDVPKLCPNCKGDYIKYIGTGTEQVEEVIKDRYKDKVCERLDLDSVMNRKELDRILNDFKKRKVDILVGTQLIAKGLDFDNVGLCGVINSDVTLNIPDYRSIERTYQLLTQVSGRAGRGSEQGKVIIQTSNPENYVFNAVKNYSYDLFFSNELKARENLSYPPFTDIIVCNFTSDKEEIANDTSIRARNYLLKIFGSSMEEYIYYPKVSTSFKGNDSFRTYILIKCAKGKRNEFVYYLDQFSKLIFDENVKCNMNIDVNPYSTI